ncbi:ricin-type beta-trefoil lectin domain protein [Streptomyces luteogriseus]|uniref:ricin-type beta-trefoil lectin domain protein n=1 Tax=Streptomyces luteogriseus TaxID=68233 RepID=UPI0037931254
MRWAATTLLSACGGIARGTGSAPQTVTVGFNASHAGAREDVRRHLRGFTINQRWTRAGNTFESLGKCLDISDSSATVTMRNCDGRASQQWTMPWDDTIRNAASGRCLDAQGRTTGEGTPIIVYDCWGMDNQQWTYPA